MTFARLFALAMAVLLFPARAAERMGAGTTLKLLEIQSVSVKGEAYPTRGKSRVRLPVAPEDLVINFGFVPEADRKPMRLSCKLEGIDEDWDRGGGFMELAVRFYGAGGDIVAIHELKVHGQSAGWRHDLATSALTHRRETLIAPPGAERLVVAISSAGPPNAEGAYVVSDLQVSQVVPGSATRPLLQFLGNPSPSNPSGEINPIDWIRDGTSPSMARIVEIGQGLPGRGLAVLDDNPLGHAEWHNNLQTAPKVNPGDHLVLEWNEMYSIGDSAMHFTRHPNLPPGEYRFQVREVDLMENPTGVEAFLTIVVPPPFWKTVWFWTMIAAGGTAGLVGAWRYASVRQQRREKLRLERAHVLERERLRIARDIHDDLGARVTQISLASAMAKDQAASADEMRAELEQISQMSRDLVTSLYETLWTVNPENDNLRELGNYLFQIVNDLCERGGCRCRIQIDDLPPQATVSSSVRHHLCMVTKEAMHNILKHAAASEVHLGISYGNNILTITIVDNGHGFDLAKGSSAGNGLANMRGRLAEIGGHFQIESTADLGTTVRCTLPIPSSPLH